MHSNNFRSGILALTLAAVFAFPMLARADGDKPVGKDAMNSLIEALVNTVIPEETAKITKIQNDKSITDEDERQRQLDAAQAELDADKAKLAQLTHDSRAGERKYDKVIRDEKTIAEEQAKANELAKKLGDANTAGTISAEDAQEMRQQILDLNADVVRLQKRIGRKEKAYQKKIGAEMTARCASPQVVDPATNTCKSCAVFEVYTDHPETDTEQFRLATCERKVCKTKDEVLNKVTGICALPPPPPKKTLTEAELRALDACYVKDFKPVGKVTTFFTLGKSNVPEGSKIANDANLEDVFDASANSIQSKLTAGDYGRIWKLEATGYTSRVQGKIKSAELAEERASNASAALTAWLKFPDDATKNPSISETGDLKTNVTKRTRDSDAETGPAWVGSEYTSLSNKKFTLAQLQAAAKKAAARIFNDKKDISPVRGTSVDETYKNLMACCSANLATLTYQPYQFTEITVYGSRFSAQAPGCVEAANKISNTTKTKEVPVEEFGNGINGLPIKEKAGDSH
jgi:hypothetical protein